MKKNKPIANKSGLLGSNGFIAPGVHVAMPFGVQPGTVFIEVETDGMLWWKRVRRVWAKRHTCRIIRCRVCGRPAASIDHHFPYYSTMNRCSRPECVEAEIEE